VLFVLVIESPAPK